MTNITIAFDGKPLSWWGDTIVCDSDVSATVTEWLRRDLIHSAPPVNDADAEQQANDRIKLEPAE